LKRIHWNPLAVGRRNEEQDQCCEKGSQEGCNCEFHFEELGIENLSKKNVAINTRMVL
jgi:hypothetical protein